MTLLPRLFLGSSAVLLALLALSAPSVEPGTAAYTISLVSAVMLGAMFVGSAALIYVDWDPFEELL